jgi:hypothetical protein
MRRTATPSATDFVTVTAEVLEFYPEGFSSRWGGEPIKVKA